MVFIQVIHTTSSESKLPASAIVAGISGRRTLFSCTWNEKRKKPHAQAERANGKARFDGFRKIIVHGGRMLMRVAIRLHDGLTLRTRARSDYLPCTLQSSLMKQLTKLDHNIGRAPEICNFVFPQPSRKRENPMGTLQNLRKSTRHCQWG